MASWPSTNYENLIPPHPPLEKGGWGDLKAIFYVMFHDGYVTLEQ